MIELGHAEKPVGALHSQQSYPSQFDIDHYDMCAQHSYQSVSTFYDLIENVCLCVFLNGCESSSFPSVAHMNRVFEGMFVHHDLVTFGVALSPHVWQAHIIHYPHPAQRPVPRTDWRLAVVPLVDELSWLGGYIKTNSKLPRAFST